MKKSPDGDPFSVGSVEIPLLTVKVSFVENILNSVAIQHMYQYNKCGIWGKNKGFVTSKMSSI